MKTKSVIRKSVLVPTALVAGGAGFVGSHVCEALLNKGARVIALDNFQTGKQNFVSHLLTNPNFALYDCDINNGLPLEVESVDYIFHLAGLEEYAFSKEVLDLNSLLTNALGTKYLLDLAHSSAAKFVLVSTVDVYEGRMSQVELSEYFGRNNIEESKYMLAEAKRYAEALVWEFYKKYQIDARIVRLPEVYGPRMSLDSSGNMGIFLKQLLDGREITVFGEGVEKEFYLYIEDAVAGVIKAMFTDKTVGNIYSLIPESPVSILELAYLVRSLADAEVRVKFEPAPNEGYFKRGILKTPDIANLANLKWGAKTPLKDGVIKALQYLNYSANVNAFKPAKFIDQKAAGAQLKEDLFSLQDVKQSPPLEIDATGRNRKTIQQPASLGINFVEKKSKWPKIGLKLPKVSWPFSRVKIPAKAFFVFQKAVLVLVFLLPAILIFLGVPLTKAYLEVKKGTDALQKIQSLAGKLDTEQIKVDSKIAYESFYNAKGQLARLQPFYNLINKQDLYKTHNRILGSLTYFSKAVYFSARSAKPFENIWEVLRPDTQTELLPQQFEESKEYLSSAQKNLQFAHADYKYIDQTLLPEKYKTVLTEYGNVLEKVSGTFDTLTPVIASLPRVLGSEGPRKYLILFQNSNEIRPTGGFIGSYGVLNIEKGKIKDLVIDDIYNPDGQIDQRNIAVAPPVPIQEFLKEEKLHLRNANWDPDFTKSAKTIEDLYFKVTGERVDAVFAADLFFVKDLLKVTGPIFLAAYNEEVTADNIYERAEFHSEFNYRDGSAQKRSFLTVLGSKLLEKLFSMSKDQLPALAGALSSSLNQRHLLISFTNDSVNDLLKKYKWDGAQVNTEGDYLYVVNSNLGGTKANYYVKNKMSYAVNAVTRDGLLRSELKLEYNHTGKDAAWPGGPYTNYVRVITRVGSRLTGATIKFGDGTEVKIFDKVTTENSEQSTVFATSFVLPPSSIAIVTLLYDLPVGLSFTRDFKEYSLYWQKQPGTQDDGYYFSFDIPFGFKPLRASKMLTLNSDRFKVAGALNEDQSVYVKLQ